MKRQKTMAGALLLAFLSTTAVPLAAQESTGPSHAGYDPNAPMGAHNHEGEIGEKLLAVELSLKCNCSCTLDAHSCQFQMQCGVSPGWTARIMRDLEAGMEVEAIQASFVADFGQSILIAPPAEGFNLVGYLLPATALIALGTLLALGIGRNAPDRPVVVDDSISAEEEERLRAALDLLDETEGPDW